MSGSCRLCGVPIKWAYLPSGQRIMLDASATAIRGEGRYRGVGEPGEARVEPLSPTYEAAGYVAHRMTCAYGQLNAGGQGDAAAKSRTRDPGVSSD